MECKLQQFREYLRGKEEQSRINLACAVNETAEAYQQGANHIASDVLEAFEHMFGQELGR